MDTDVELKDAEVWRTGDLLIDMGSATVHRKGEEIQVIGLSFGLLIALVRAAPALLSQDELIDQVWEGRVVSPETVVQRIKLLRDALGDHADDPQYVGLVKRRGYKWLPVAQRVPAEQSGAPSVVSRLGTRPMLGLVAVLLLLVFLSPQFQGEQREFNEPLRAGIAVLPFSSQGTVPEGGDFFAVGVHDDILTELARIDDLLVISRTSVLSYQDVQRPIIDIGRELNVDKILEGNVQRTADTVKINVQLIDAESDTHLWAQGYERELSVANVIKTQRQIAVDVARALKLSLDNLPAERAPPTQSVAAYDAYLSARQLGNRAAQELQLPGSFHRVTEPLAAAIEKLLSATVQDPGFADAHALLSILYSMRYRGSVARDTAVLNKAAVAAFEAMKLNPDLPAVHMALSEYYFSIGEHEKSLDQLRQASRGQPENTGLLMALAMKTLMAGRAEESLPLAERAVAQDPLNTSAANMLVIIRYFSGDLAGAQAAIKRAISLSPDNVALAYMGATFRFAATADLAQYRKTIEALPINDAQSVHSHWDVAFLSRDYPGALSVLQAGPKKTFVTYAQYLPVAYLAGITHLMAGSHSMARTEMAKARRELEAVRLKDPTDPRVLSRLAAVLAVLGEQQLAREAVDAAQKSPRYRTNAVFARIWRRTLIEALILNGDLDDALELFETYSHNPGNLPVASFLMRPTLDPLR
ncbi:MAG: winged helix-turn-helix domain-containing protein [Halioglobus sp.]